MESFFDQKDLYSQNDLCEEYCPILDYLGQLRFEYNKKQNIFYLKLTKVQIQELEDLTGLEIIGD